MTRCQIIQEGALLAKVSIIIPVKEINEYAKESISHLRRFYPDCEILLVPDYDDGTNIEGVTIIASWPIVAPGEKRDMAAKLANGDLLAFIDDDAYPSENWLSAALPHLEDPEIAAVGGPGVTPPSDGYRRRASGWILASPLGSGGYTYRFRPGRLRTVDDFPSMNLIVKATEFFAVGGFKSRYWPGEDTEFCRKLISDLGKKIIYEPNAVVYHHRREVFGAHLRQQARYGLHRGHFAKQFAGNSRRIAYAVPAIFTIGLIVGLPISLVSSIGAKIYLSVLVTYLFALLVTGIWVWKHEDDFRVVPYTLLGMVATHAVYGYSYLKGLFSDDLLH